MPLVGDPTTASVAPVTAAARSSVGAIPLSFRMRHSVHRHIGAWLWLRSRSAKTRRPADGSDGRPRRDGFAAGTRFAECDAAE